MSIRNISVFCGASAGTNPVYVALAKQLADALLATNMNLVYGGAKVGLMGELAAHLLAGGGKVIGVMPTFLSEKEIAHTGISELHLVDTMSERKNLIMELSDAFILMPGGIGSLDEFFEVLTLAQLGVLNKPRGILNVANYYDDLVKFLDHAVKEDFWNKPNRSRLFIENDPMLMINKFLHYQEPSINRWQQGLVAVEG
jgi:uncharacterized protein (TIGR00730 family)